MRRFMTLIVGMIFIFVALAFATDKPSSIPSKVLPVKSTTTPVKTRVSFAGIVKEISDTTILVDRAVKGKVETMEFGLDKPFENIKAGDRVRISYVKKNGKNIAMKIAPVVDKKIMKRVTPAMEIVPAPLQVTPPQK